MEKLKGFKTVIFNVIMTAVVVLKTWGVEVDVNAEDVATHLGALEMALMFLWGVGNVILRAITDSPIFKRKEIK